MTIDMDRLRRQVMSTDEINAACEEILRLQAEVEAAEYDPAAKERLHSYRYLQARQKEQLEAARKCLEYCATSPQAIRKDIREDAEKVLKQLSG